MLNLLNLNNCSTIIYNIFVINYQGLHGIGMTHKVVFLTLIVLCSIGLGRLIQSYMVVIVDFSVGVTIMKVDNLASTLQVFPDKGKKYYCHKHLLLI